MPDEDQQEQGTLSSSEEKRVVEAPRRNPPEELIEDAFGVLPGERPAKDDGGAELPLAPEPSAAAKRQDSETHTPD